MAYGFAWNLPAKDAAHTEAMNACKSGFVLIFGPASGPKCGAGEAMEEGRCWRDLANKSGACTDGIAVGWASSEANFPTVPRTKPRVSSFGAILTVSWSGTHTAGLSRKAPVWTKRFTAGGFGVYPTGGWLWKQLTRTEGK